ncbi:YsnF/AvaK domain-containing protein, partial [Nostoc sp. NIES-2111]
VDNEGRFRYLVIDTNLEDSISKKILLPIGLSHIDYPARRVYVDGLSKEQVAHLPEYHDNIAVDADYEERVRGVFRPQTSNLTYDRQTYNYQQEPALYDLNDQYHQTFKLYEERLIANKQRVKTGEVAVGKHIETETARVEVPIQRERVVIERSSPTSTDAVVDSSEVHFQQGEVARIELYEETPEIRKEAFVREEVRVRKIIENDTVEAQEVIRREELDIDTEGNLLVNETNLEKHGNV